MQENTTQKVMPNILKFKNLSTKHYVIIQCFKVIKNLYILSRKEVTVSEQNKQWPFFNSVYLLFQFGLLSKMFIVQGPPGSAHPT